LIFSLNEQSKRFALFGIRLLRLNSESARRLAIFLVLFLCVFVALRIRLQGFASLGGELLIDTDSYRFLRQADLIVAQGGLPKRDMMRWLPLGRDLTHQLSLSSYVIAYLYRLLHLFHPHITLYQTAVFYPLVLFPSILLALFAVTKQLFNRNVALLAVAILGVLPPMVVIPFVV